MYFFNLVSDVVVVSGVLIFAQRQSVLEERLGR